MQDDGLREHPFRAELTAEVHARPYMHLTAPERVTHLALVTGEDGAEEERRIVGDLLASRGAPPPAPGANFHLADLGAFRLRWERHTEFSTYGFFAHEPAPEPFAERALALVPPDWLPRLPGQVLAAIALVLEPDPDAETAGRKAPDLDRMRRLMGIENFAGSIVAGGAAEAWMNFTAGPDGFGRILVRDRRLGLRQAGRLVQRLLEIETYRMMALLALPPARAEGKELTRLGARLTDIAGSIVGAEDEHALLERLAVVAAETERIAAATTYRFGAARAYRDLVERRIHELREQRMEGIQTIGEFMERRFKPAMSTVQAADDRQEALSRRVARTSQLLRTRIEVRLAEQNRDLLHSMDRRASLQLALQETVEGLSVAAITYYAVGLISYLVKAIHGLGVDVPVDETPGFAIPIVAAIVWLGLRRVRRMLAKRSGHGE